MKFISLISSGIDSPVATYLISKISKEIILLHGDIRPFTDNRVFKNFIILASHLKKISNSVTKAKTFSTGASITIGFSILAN